LENGIWQTANRFGEQRINLENLTSPHIGKVRGRMLVKLNGKLFAKRSAPATFRLAHNLR